MEELKQEIKQTENWLREHPHADWLARHDMIKKLADLNEQAKEIWPEIHTEEEIRKIQGRISSVSFSREYLNNPSK